MSNRFRRIVSTAVAILIALSTVFVCAPPAAAAEGHCQPSAAMQARCSHCPPKDVMDCCATSAPEPASVPENGQQGTPAASASTAVPPTIAAVLASLQVPDLARALREAPQHGYRSFDLPLLNATFLI